MGVLGGYLTYILYAALQINTDLEDMYEIWGKKRFDLCIAVDEGDESKYEYRRSAYRRACSLHTSLRDHPFRFTFLGFEITKAFFISGITTLVGLIASWVYSLLSGQD